jgi:hypothetical protein
MTEFATSRRLHSASVGIARRRTEEKRADTLFVCERRRSRGVQSAMREQRDQ